MKVTRTRNFMAAALVCALAVTAAHAQSKPSDSPYKFERGYPAPGTAERVYDASDLRRAVEAYKFFYPTVASEALMQQMAPAGATDNEVSVVLATGPRHVLPTGNSDTPYAIGILNLKTAGPLVVELPAGSFIGFVNDHHGRWVHDMGLPGPDKGQGGKHLVLPPGYTGDVPAGYHVGRSKTWKAILAVRSLSAEGDIAKAIKAVDGIKVYPLAKAGQPVTHRFLDVSNKVVPFPLLAWEHNIEFWRQLKVAIDAEPVAEEFRPFYGMLASLGIEQGKPFNPDARTRKILEEAARTGFAELRTYAYASRRPERVFWPDRKWEWLVLQPTTAERGDFEAPTFLDLEARDFWFFQAYGTSPAMGKRQVGAGSIYFAAFRDKTGAYLDGGKSYKLTVPGPVPGRLFWSATVYDVDTRSQIATDQNKAALRSLFEKFQANPDGSIDLFFGPIAPAGKESQWVKTIPGKGWFTYFRIYGPQQPAFDGTWKLHDLIEAK